MHADGAGSELSAVSPEFQNLLLDFKMMSAGVFTLAKHTNGLSGEARACKNRREVTRDWRNRAT